MKKLVTILLLSVLIFTFPISSFATNNGTELNSKNVNDLLDKYGLEIDSSAPLVNELPEDSTYSLEELEEIIKNELNKPKEIKMKDIHVNNLPNLSSSLYSNDYISPMASIGSATLYYYGTVYNNLKMKYTASGRYRFSGGKPLWTSATSSSVSEVSNSYYSELKKVIKTRATVTHGGKRLKQYYKFEVQNYISVPIPKVGKVLRVKSGSPIVEGNVYHYAYKI